MTLKNILTAFAAAAFAAVMPASAKSGRPAELTVISYNIRNGEANDGTNSWQYRYPASAMMISDQAPDIFGLQEAYGYQVRYLEEYCKGYKSVGVGREDGKHRGEHMSIFYKVKTIKLLKWGTYWLSDTPDKPSLGWDGACMRTATWALMKDRKSGWKFYYVNTHLDHVGVQARIRGLELIVNRIKDMNRENYPMILTGDFNTDAEDHILDGLNSMMTSARNAAVKTDKGETFNGWGKSHDKVIDHIYFSGFSACTLFEVIRKPYMERTYISDHYPVKAVLIF